MGVPATIGPWRGVALWDVSTGDPIVPAPRPVTIERILGDPVTLLGYATETNMSEKGLTILERGITSNRWRDYVDIVALGRAGFDEAELLRAAWAVAGYRGVVLGPVAPLLEDYGAMGQAKCAAWRRKEGIESLCEENLDDQAPLAASILDPTFSLGPG